MSHFNGLRNGLQLAILFAAISVVDYAVIRYAIGDEPTIRTTVRRSGSLSEFEKDVLLQIVGKNINSPKSRGVVRALLAPVDETKRGRPFSRLVAAFPSQNAPARVLLLYTNPLSKTHTVVSVDQEYVILDVVEMDGWARTWNAECDETSCEITVQDFVAGVARHSGYVYRVAKDGIIQYEEVPPDGEAEAEPASERPLSHSPSERGAGTH